MPSKLKPAYVILKADPNPDYADYDYRGVLKLKARKVKVESFEQASQTCRKFIDCHDLGGGNWTGGQIFDENDVQIAHVSYNGRVWEGKENPPHIGKEIRLCQKS